MKKMLPMMMVMMIIVISAITFVGQGVNKQNQVAGEEATFHSLQTDYIVNITEADRDSAAVDSALALQQAEIANYPSTLLELKLVGVGKMLTGIAILLVGILMALVMMPVRLAKEIKKNS
jgi:hypothetical protein